MADVEGQIELYLRFLKEDAELRDFARRYWAPRRGPGMTLQYPEPVSDICREFGLPQHEAIDLLSQVVVATFGNCASCNKPLRVRSRTDLQNCYSRRQVRCGECLAAEHERQEEQARRVAEERAARQMEEDRQRRDMIYEAYDRDLDVMSISDLSLEDAVYLSAVFRASPGEDLETIEPLSGKIEPVAPTGEYEAEVLKHLHARKLIQVDPLSDLSAFDFSSGQPDRFYLYKVIWRVASTPDGTRSLVREVEKAFRADCWPSDWHDEVLPLWRKIALYECLEYLDVQIQKHELEFTPGDKTRMVLEDALSDFSVSQVYCMIYRAVKDAAAFYMSHKVTVHHAANTVVGKIQRHAERAKAENWDVSKYRRDFECPQSTVSKVLFDAILRIGTAGFDDVPKWPLGGQD